MNRERLIERITKGSEHCDKTQCLIWQGANSGKKGRGAGYGKISVMGVSSYVHRVMYVCYNGYIPNKMQVDHICRNRMCCNPAHLEAVSQSENCKRKKTKI